MARVTRDAMTTTEHGPADAPTIRTRVRRSGRGLLARLGAALGAALALATLAGCENEGIGDPCIPESVPPGGFDDREAYLETSSVQCRTRVCIVDRLRGDPTKICEDTGGMMGCASRDAVDRSVYCTCRCDGPPGVADFCECPEGFICKEILSSGGVGIRGSYCIRPKEGD